MKPRQKFPRGVATHVDQDYWDRLSEEEREWLSRFNDEFYGAYFTEGAIHQSTEQRKQAGRDKGARVHDIYARGLNASTGEAPNIADIADRDWSTPDYDGPEYRKAVNELRAEIPRDQRRKVELTPRLQEKMRAVDEIAGASSRRGGPIGLQEGYRMSGNRLKKLQDTLQIINHLGITVSRHEFKGEEAEAAVGMLKWLTAFREKVAGKLKAMGHPIDAPKD